jgi:hypothetical protein
MLQKVPPAVHTGGDLYTVNSAWLKVRQWKVSLQRIAWISDFRLWSLLRRIYTVQVKLKKIKLSLYLTNEALRKEGVWGSGCTDPRFLGLGSSWRWAVSFTPRTLYPRGKTPRYPLHSRGWIGLRTGLDDAEKRKFLTLSGFELRPLGHPARSQSLYRLHYPCSGTGIRIKVEFFTIFRVIGISLYADFP